MAFKYKLVAFDLDGTLALSKQSIDDSMAEILMDLLSKTKVAVISGGSFEQFKIQLLEKLMNQGESEIAPILANLILLPTDGSCRYGYDVESGEWKKLHEELFPDAIKEKVTKMLESIINEPSYDLPAIIYGERVEDRGTQITFSALGQRAPLELKSKWDPTQSKRLTIKKELEELIPEIDAVVGGTTSIDILPKGFNKAVGLVQLLKSLDLQKEEIVFIGDAVFPGGNDYSPYEAGIKTIKTAGPEETKQIIQDIIKE